jgi:hypothetical protein
MDYQRDLYRRGSRIARAHEAELAILTGLGGSELVLALEMFERDVSTFSMLI